MGATATPSKAATSVTTTEVSFYEVTAIPTSFVPTPSRTTKDTASSLNPPLTVISFRPTRSPGVSAPVYTSIWVPHPTPSRPTQPSAMPSLTARTTIPHATATIGTATTSGLLTTHRASSKRRAVGEGALPPPREQASNARRAV